MELPQQIGVAIIERKQGRAELTWCFAIIPNIDDSTRAAMPTILQVFSHSCFGDPMTIILISIPPIVMS